jgi:hypothetical protein
MTAHGFGCAVSICFLLYLDLTFGALKDARYSIKRSNYFEGGSAGFVRLQSAISFSFVYTDIVFYNRL